MQFLTNHAGIPIAYCNAINASTDSLTLSGLTVVAGKIYKAFFTKFILDLPVEVEAQTTYYLRLSSSVIKIYTTLANAQAQTSPINFATTASGTLFLVYFPEQTYPALTCWEIGAATIADIVCCPPVPDVGTSAPNQATVNYNGVTKTLYMYNTDNYHGALNSNYFSVGPYTYLGYTVDLYVQIAFYFKGYSDGTVYSKPTAAVNVIYKYGALWYEGFGGHAVYTTTSDFSTSLTLNFQRSDLSGNEGPLRTSGQLPSTLTFTFSGQVVPPPQIKVYMPDAYFENKAAPITLGLVEETLTYDAATLTYWSDLKTLAGIKGRLHFAIPNFYSLASLGAKYIDYLYFYNGFPDAMLNTYSNAEFLFYPTLSVQRLTGDPYFPYIGNQLKLFTASDFYGGYPNEDPTTLPTLVRDAINQTKSYPTGLALNATWFDSRVVRNYDPTDPFVLGLSPSYVIRPPAKITIAFSKWASGKFLKSNQLGSELYEAAGNLNHYHQSAYFVQSVNSGAYVSSLGL